MTDEQLIEAIAVEVMGWMRPVLETGRKVVLRCAVYPNFRKGEEVTILSTHKNSVCIGREYSNTKIMVATGYDDPAFGLYPYGWNPLADWNHWRQVEEKLFENKDALEGFVDYFAIDDAPYHSVKNYMKTDLRTRCLAALKAVRSL